MKLSYYLCFLCGWIKHHQCETVNNSSKNVRTFPKGFSFGASSSAYQIEGAWNEDGKSESIWDHLLHTRPEMDKEGKNGDTAANSYHLYKRDVEMIKELGLDFYRFSLSWPRILPTSFPNELNQAGIDYYNDLIGELLKNNIEPMITLYHWDLPQTLQELGGWTNPLVVDWFADYARIAFRLFGDRVKYWITINEPLQICYLGYGSTRVAPALNLKGMSEYMCSKYVLLAHAKAYHIYDQEFRITQQGFIFIAIDVEWMESDPQRPDVEAVEDASDFWWGIYAHPIFSETGDYPESLKNKLNNISAEQGYSKSRLLPFTAEEVDYLKGTSDFFGLNHYSTFYVYHNDTVIDNQEVAFYLDDIGVIMYQDDKWKLGESDAVKYVPDGFYKVLTNIREKYNNPPMFITENGFATRTGLTDDDRITYIRSYLDVILDAIDETSDIRGYSVWALMDDYEWLGGYIERFGLYEVDYDSPQRTRTPRKSAFVYKEIVRTRALDMHYEPDTTLRTDSGSSRYNNCASHTYGIILLVFLYLSI